MNIVQLQKSLQGLPDQALAGYMQTPNGEVPQYLVLSELNRRKTLRQSAAASQAPQQAPQSTVKDDIMGGVMSLPQQPAPEGYAEGGLVSFAGGGNVDRGYSQYDYRAPYSFSPEEIAQARAFDEQRAAEQAAFFEANPEAAADYSALQDVWGKTKDIAGAVGSKLGDVATLIPRTVATGINQIARVPRAMGVNVPQIPGGFDVAALQGRGASAPAGVGKQKDLFDVISAAQGGQGAPVVPSRASAATPQAAPPAGGLGSLSASARAKTAGGVGGKGVGVPDDLSYKAQSPEDFDKAWRARYEKLRGEAGDEFKDDKERLAQAREELAGNKQQNINQAMIQAGLGMMAGKSQHALTNIGEGGMQGLAFLQKANQADAVEKRALMEAQSNVTRAEAAARRGDQQTAIQLQGQVEKDRQFAVTAAQQRENYLLAHQDRMAQINATLQAASMRVSQGSGTKQDQLALKAAQMAEGSAKAWAMANKNNPEYVINPQKFEQDYQAKIAEGYTRAYAVIGREMPEAVQAPAQPQKQNISFGSLK